MKSALLFVFVAVWLIPFSAEAFLCNGKDFGCMASWILPNNQVNDRSRDYHEWAANEGHVVGKEGNVIEFRLRFDAESLETLSYIPRWHSPARILLEIQNFGLEIDICDPSDTLHFDYVKSTFPDNSRPTQDTSLSDSINTCKNAMGLLVRNPGVIKPDTDYFVRFYLKDSIPSGGIVVTPSLQITAETKLLENAIRIPEIRALFNTNLLEKYIDKYEYFVVESDNYTSANAKGGYPWWIYPSGIGGLCWDSKRESYPCPVATKGPAMCLKPTPRENPQKHFGVVVLDMERLILKQQVKEEKQAPGPAKIQNEQHQVAKIKERAAMQLAKEQKERKKEKTKAAAKLAKEKKEKEEKKARAAQKAAKEKKEKEEEKARAAAKLAEEKKKKEEEKKHAEKNKKKKKK